MLKTLAWQMLLLVILGLLSSRHSPSGFTPGLPAGTSASRGWTPGVSHASPGVSHVLRIGGASRLFAHARLGVDISVAQLAHGVCLLHVKGESLQVRQAAIEHAGVAPAHLEDLARLGSLYVRRAGSRKYVRLYDDGETDSVLASVLSTEDVLRIHTAPVRYAAACNGLGISWRDRCCFVDPRFVVVNKPAGLPCSPHVSNAAHVLHRCMLHELANTRRDSISTHGSDTSCVLQPGETVDELIPLHRLDSCTSGLVTLARTKAAAAAFGALQERGDGSSAAQGSTEGGRPFLKMYRACFLAPMSGPPAFLELRRAAERAGDGQATWHTPQDGVSVSPWAGSGASGPGAETHRSSAEQSMQQLEIRSWISSPLYEMPAPRFVSTVAVEVDQTRETSARQQDTDKTSSRQQQHGQHGQAPGVWKHAVTGLVSWERLSAPLSSSSPFSSPSPSPSPSSSTSPAALADCDSGNASAAALEAAAHELRLRAALQSEGVAIASEEDNLCLWEARLLLHTGRTHQIRAQMAALGLPLLADETYTAMSGHVFTASYPPPMPALPPPPPPQGAGSRPAAGAELGGGRASKSAHRPSSGPAAASSGLPAFQSGLQNMGLSREDQPLYELYAPPCLHVRLRHAKVNPESATGIGLQASSLSFLNVSALAPDPWWRTPEQRG